MILYRAVDQRWAGAEDVTSGYGAKKDGGRWNQRGKLCLYCGENASVALAEAGFYALILILMHLRANDSPPKGILTHIRNSNGLERRLVTLDAPLTLRALPDLSAKQAFQLQAAEFGMSLPYERALISDWQGDGRTPTQLFGQYMIESGTIGFAAQSARSADRLIVFYPDNFPSNMKIRKTAERTVHLWYCDDHGTRWDGKNLDAVSDNGIIVDWPKRKEELVSIRLGGIPT